MKKILIALDYSPNAELIADAGYALAKATNASVILMHVVAEPTYYSALDYSPIMGYNGFSSLDILNDLAAFKKASQDFLDQSKAHLGDESITTLVGEGDCAQAILDAAIELNVDTIVMGTHSRHGLEKILMGSISEKVLRHTTLPLYIIPTSAKE
jgi:nucleotide-binding universal stress UspA family protein